MKPSPKMKFVVHYRENPSSPQWEDTFDKGTNDENKAQAEKRAYEIMLNGGIAVVIGSNIPGQNPHPYFNESE